MIMFKKAMSAAILFFATFFMAFSASAQFVGSSGAAQKYVERTVAQVQDVRQGSYVTLTGHIIAHEREDYYTFRDATGTIRVEIDHKLWPETDITPEMKVIVMGEVERSARGRYIDVDMIRIAP